MNPEDVCLDEQVSKADILRSVVKHLGQMSELHDKSVSDDKNLANGYRFYGTVPHDMRLGVGDRFLLQMLVDKYYDGILRDNATQDVPASAEEIGFNIARDWVSVDYGWYDQGELKRLREEDRKR